MSEHPLSSKVRVLYQEALQRRAPFENKWRTLSALTTSQRFDTFDDSIERNADDDYLQYSSTPPTALRNFANTFTSLLIEPSLTGNYFSLRPTQSAVDREREVLLNEDDNSDEAVNRRYEVEGQSLAEISDKIFQELRTLLQIHENRFSEILQEAEFAKAVASAVFEQLAFGTGILCVMGRGVKGAEKLSIKCAPLANIAMLSDGEEGFMHFFRKYRMTMEVAKQRWHNIKIPQAIESRSVEEKDRLQSHLFIEALIHTKPDPLGDSEWQHLVYMPDIADSPGSTSRGVVVSPDVVTLKDCPYVVLHWTPKPESPYGLPLLDTAESDILAINEAVVSQTMLTDLNVRNPIMADSMQFPNAANMDLRAGAIIPAEMSSVKQGDPLRPLQLANEKAFVPIANEIARLQISIEARTYANLIIPDHTRTPSRDETSNRLNVVLQQIGVQNIDLSFSALRKVGWKALRVLSKSSRKEYESLPAEILSDEHEINITPNSPMIEIKQDAAISKKMAFLATAQQVMPTVPIPAMLNLESVFKDMCRMAGIQEGSIYSERDTDELIEEQQAQQEAALQAQAQQQQPQEAA